jgi:hypothetical protein
MIDEQQIRMQLTRLAVIHTQLNAAKTFDAFVDVIGRERRLSSMDLVEAVNALLATPDDVRIIPGRVIDYAYRARAQRLAQARIERKDTPGPSTVPYGDTCGKCGGMLEVAVSERAIWCPTCKTVRVDRVGLDGLRVHEVDAALIDGEIRLANEKREARLADHDLERWRHAA